MSKLPRVHCLLATLVAWQMLLAVPGYAAPANQKLIFKHVWTAPNTEISNPQFSSDASAITFTRKPHSLDGDEAECYEDGAAKDGPSKSAKKNKDDPRWEDPKWFACLCLTARTFVPVQSSASTTDGTPFFQMTIKQFSTHTK